MTYGSVDGLEVTARRRRPAPDPRPAREAQRRQRHDDGGLADAIDAAGRDEAVRVIVLAGDGDHFCGGADIVARNAAGRGAPPGGQHPAAGPSTAHRLIPAGLQTQTPVVCRVQGWAAGIGFQLAAAADFTVAADDARFWEPFTERGFTPDSGATWLLPRLVGIVRARELLLLGRDLDGTEAAEWGLVHRAVPGRRARRRGRGGRRAARRGADRRPRVHQVAPGRGPDRDARGPAPERGPRPRAVVAQRGLPRGPEGLRREAPARVPGPVVG